MIFINPQENFNKIANLSPKVESGAQRIHLHIAKPTEIAINGTFDLRMVEWLLLVIASFDILFDTEFSLWNGLPEIRTSYAKA